MLRVVIELWPGGRENLRRELATMNIANVTGLSGVDDYAIYAAEGVNPVAGRGAWESRGLICRHPRSQSVFSLISKGAAWANLEAEKR